MPGEEGRAGWANTSLFASLVQDLGWEIRGPIDQNIECEKCQPYANGNPRTHGVDAIFTLFCPYLNRSRAVIVDGKRYTFESVGGPKTLRSWLDDSIKTTMHARESCESLFRTRNIPPGTSVDTVLVAWDCHEGWNANKAKSWLKNIRLGHTPPQTISALIATKEHLDKLQTIVSFKKTVNNLQFLYNCERLPMWSDTLTPELLYSSILLIKYQNSHLLAPIIGAIYFDINEPCRIRFLVRVLIHAGLLTHDQIAIHIPCKNSQLEHFENYFNAELRSLGQNENSTSFNFSQLPISLFQS